MLDNLPYPAMFGAEQKHMTAAELWRHIFNAVKHELSPTACDHITLILEKGCLAKRILAHTGTPTRNAQWCRRSTVDWPSACRTTDRSHETAADL